MNGGLQVRYDVTIPEHEIWFTASRSGGPGGQHVNTTSSRVTLHWHVPSTAALTEEQRSRVLTRLSGRISADGLLQLSVDSERSQHRNRQIAADRLVELVRKALSSPKKRIPTKASRASKRRRLEEKRRRGNVKRLRSRDTFD